MNFQEHAEQNRLYSGIKKGITYIEQVTYIVHTYSLKSKMKKKTLL